MRSLLPGPGPRGLRIAAPAVALQGVISLLYGVYLGIQGVRFGATGPAAVSNVPGIVIEVLLYVGFGAALIAVARGIWNESGWSRSPAVLAQLLIAVIAFPLAQADGPERVVGGLLAIGCVAVLIGVFLPSSGRAFERRQLPGTSHDAN